MTTNVITQDRPSTRAKRSPMLFHSDHIILVPTDSPGKADIVGFGLNGVVVLRNGSVMTFNAINDFGYNAGGWRIDKHVRLVANITNDRDKDIVGFGEDGVLVSINNGNNTFTQPVKLVLKDFAYNAGGWRVDKHIRYLAY